MASSFYGELQQLLQTHDLSFSRCLITLLTAPDGCPIRNNLRHDLSTSIAPILSAFTQISGTRNWIETYQTQIYAREIHTLTDTDNGWHFSALRASPEQIDNFALEEMAGTMESEAPNLWRLFSDLSLSRAGGKRKQPEPEDGGMGVEEKFDAEEEEYWNQVEGLTREGLDSGQKKAAAEKVRQRRSIVQKIRKVTAVSILMLSHNQKCNLFASVLGIFCHANNTPEKVIEVLSRLGISISINAVNDAITSLSKKCAVKLRDLGQTLLAAYAYDNLDIDLKTSVPTVEKSTDHLKHLTTGLMFPLPSSVSSDDLKCSR
ncbi:hypothetical protein NLI96_g6866 [Meripilus lineatus]|uniref:Uncharacterized protein n=1 Tax=Meripilus lineatus TaxID=2056292 RepID=A0AAD5V0T2_9APHY|nr:hypothetical protein NLI96_g6866 [Physisporinus lineatus]